MTLTARPATVDDIPALVDIGCAADVAWWGSGAEDTDEDEVRMLLELSGDLEEHSRVLLDGSAIVALGTRRDHAETTLSVDPRRPRATQEEAYDALLPWLAGIGGTTAEAPSQDRTRLAALARHGFVRERSSFELELPAGAVLEEPAWPDGTQLVPFDRDDDGDLAALHALIYSVWTDVPGHNHRPLPEWRRIFLDHEAYDPKLVVLAERDGAPAGVAICRVFPTSNTGWLMQLAVGRPARGLGLGRALLLEGLGRLRDTGADAVGLSVEAENAGALGLYRSVGLEITREWVRCRRAAPAAAPGVAPPP